MNETLDTVDGRSVLRVRRRFAHPPGKVWRAITRPEHLREWFPCEVAIDLRLRGEVSFDFGDGDTTHGVVTELDPPRVLAFTWGDDVLRFELQPDGAGCALVFDHTFDDRAGAASFASGWHLCLAGLGAVLDGTPVQEPADSVRLHETYIAEFGLDAGTAEDTADGWRVRFERQLTEPVERVWATLTGSDSPAVGGPVPPGFTTAEFPATEVTALEAPHVLEYGRVRWELTDGTGHGARLILTHAGTAEQSEERATALAAWRSRVEQLAGLVSAARGR